MRPIGRIGPICGARQALTVEVCCGSVLNIRPISPILTPLKLRVLRGLRNRSGDIFHSHLDSEIG